MPPKTTALPHQAAKLSWACPIVVFVLVALEGQVGARVIIGVIIELIALLLIVVGLISGVIALFGISKHGTKGILAPAIVGIILNGLLLFIFVTTLLRLYGMFQPHTYDWSTGMPSLEDQVTAFQQAEKRWPTNYDDLVSFMKQSNSEFVPTSYDRIDFETKPDGNLEIVVYVFNSGFTNHIILKAPPKI